MLYYRFLWKVFVIKGIRCESNCPEGRFGENCDHICNCKNNSSCDITGRCYCSPGWHGDDCDIPCDEGYYGIGCHQRCLDTSLGTHLNCFLPQHRVTSEEFQMCLFFYLNAFTNPLVFCQFIIFVEMNSISSVFTNSRTWIWKLCRINQQTNFGCFLLLQFLAAKVV